jgi:ribose 5-phosphate isomerase B
MRVAVAADHAGYPLKQAVLDQVAALGHEAIDLGTHNTDAVDYPDFAQALGQAIIDGRADRGIVLCGSGVGASVAANKLRGIRAAVCHDTYSAHQGVEHDDMNVLSIGARVVGPEVAAELVRAFVTAKFSNEPRHRRRLDKVLAIEDASMPAKEESHA